MESVDKCTESLEPEKVTSVEENVGHGDKMDEDKSDKDAEKEEELPSSKSPQIEHCEKSPSPKPPAERKTDEMNEPTPESEATASSHTGNEETLDDKGRSPSPNHSPISYEEGKEEGPSIISNEDEKEDSNETEGGIRPSTSSKVNESERDEGGSRKDTSQISKENVSKEAEIVDAAEDISTSQKTLPDELGSIGSSSNVEISEKAEERALEVSEAAEATTEEPMDIDDEKGTDKPSSETEEESHAMATADVYNESRDDLIEVSTHEEENDPLSSPDEEKDVEMSADENPDQEKSRDCEVEIHMDIAKDGQFNEDDSGDGEKSNDDSSKDKETSKEDSVDKDNSSNSSEKAIESSKKDSEDGKKSKAFPRKDNETSIVPNSETTKEVSLKTSEEGIDTSKDATKTSAQATSKEGNDEVCTIPDSVPQSVDKSKDAVDQTAPVTSLSNVKATETSSDNIEEIEEVIEIKGARKERRKYRTGLTLTMGADLTAPRQQRQAAKKAESQIKVLAAAESIKPPPNPKPALKTLDRVTDCNPCQQCGLVTFCKYQVQSKDSYLHFCRELCYNEYQSPNETSSVPIISDSESGPETATPAESERSFERTCSKCSAKIIPNDEKVLTWETMDFCSDDCLGKYQCALGSHCVSCKGAVQSASLGKYCVRFGLNIKQFCCAGCLEEFKKGLKVCSYCQKDISSFKGGFLAPVGERGQFKDFCTQVCMEKYEQLSSSVVPPLPSHECAVCMKLEPVRVEVLSDGRVHKLCSNPCFAAFKFVNTSINLDQCDMCKKYFNKAKTEDLNIYYDDAPHSFCSKTCVNVYILAKRKIVPCSWCKVKKYNFDMIKKTSSNGQAVTMCSLNCLKMFQLSASAVTARRVKCDACGNNKMAQYHLTMSDGSMRNFCSYHCVGVFQSKFSQSTGVAGGKDSSPVPTGGPRRSVRRSVSAETETVPKSAPLPVIASVTSLAPNGEPLPVPAGCSVPGTPKARPQARNFSDREQADVSKPTSEGSLTAAKHHIIVRPPHQPKRHNRGVQVEPLRQNKGVSIKPQCCTKETQTDDDLSIKQRTLVAVPIPIPIYVPTPMYMYNAPTPLPVPFPLPIPVPIFIPTTRNSHKGIMKEIKRIQEKIPADPFEAELVMMAEMVATEKKTDNADECVSEEAPPEGPAAADAGNGVDQNFTPEAVDSSNTFGEDIMQMAFKLASSLDEQPIDFDTAVAPSTITSGGAHYDDDTSDSDADDSDSNSSKKSSRKRPARSLSRSSGPSKRSRRVSSSESLPIPSDGSNISKADIERPDANMCLKYMFGVNAWRQWVLQKNAQLEKAATSNRKLKLFKTDLLLLTADELNYSLCLFVKEVRKPNGSEYAPDTIYYLCLGIQLYLIENGRVDNIFSDPLYEKFTECLDEMSKKFCALYDDTQYIVTRVEEEHLWESKQLGAHSPQVLLSTLMFFNTKHFNMTTVDEHVQLSFSHIMKHWKRNNNSPGSAGKPPGRNVLLRFYPSQAQLVSNSKKKKVYEQTENEENPLRCPVKLYEFYLSKCPESVKTRNDVFYLQPERSCVPDSPVWYSTMSLDKDTLIKMFRRVKMVKEINMAILK